MPLELNAAPAESLGVKPNPPGLLGQTAKPATRPIRLLSYVHLRNIHASTGAGRVARQLTEHLALREDIDLRILADEADKTRVLPLVGEPWKSFRYHTFASDTSRQQARWFALNSPRAESYWADTDIVFCTGEAYVPTRTARLVVTAHDAAYFEGEAHRQGAAYWRQRMKWKLLFGRLAAHADMIHTVSQFSADRLAHFFPALAARIRVVPNAVTPEFLLPVAVDGLRFLGEHGLLNRSYVFVPGGLHFRKNAELILAAAPRLLQKFPGLLLVIAGHSDLAYASAARALGPRVLLSGFIDDTSLHALYASAAVVWFPSRYEGFGMPLLEAMAAGAPVVASRASSIPEVGGAAALLAGVDSPQQHLDALCGLLEQPALRERFSLAGRERAAHFTWQRSAALLKRCFDELL